MCFYFSISLWETQRSDSRVGLWWWWWYPLLLLLCFVCLCRCLTRKKKSYKESCFPYLFLKGKKHWNTHKKRAKRHSKLKYETTMHGKQFKMFPYFITSLLLFIFYSASHNSLIYLPFFFCWDEVQKCVCLYFMRDPSSVDYANIYC